jgi:hypothetical protein
MKENQKLKMEDFLQQFPQQEMYESEGIPFDNWWETGEDPTIVGQPVDLAAMFNGTPTVQA